MLGGLKGCGLLGGLHDADGVDPVHPPGGGVDPAGGFVIVLRSRCPLF